jgi:hypothetical protein
MMLHPSAYVSIRQHTSAYFSIRQHTSAYVSIRQHTSAYVSIPVAQREDVGVGSDDRERARAVSNRDAQRRMCAFKLPQAHLPLCSVVYIVVGE